MALTAANVRVGAGRIFMDVTSPALGVALNIGATGIPSTGGGDVEVGLTEGEAIFTYEVSYFEVMAEQSLASIEVFAHEEMAQLEFTMKEYITANIDDFFNGLTNQATVAAPGSADTIRLHEGGRILGQASAAGEVTLQSVCLIAPIPNTSSVNQRFTYVILHQAYQSEAAAARYSKSGDTLMKVTFKAIADLTRGDTATLFTLGIEANP